jgi:hypothetical protein
MGRGTIWSSFVDQDGFAVYKVLYAHDGLKREERLGLDSPLAE